MPGRNKVQLVLESRQDEGRSLDEKGQCRIRGSSGGRFLSFLPGVNALYSLGGSGIRRGQMMCEV